MSNLYFSGKYKDQIIKLLINNEMVIKLINPTMNPNLDIVDVLMGGELIDDNGEKIKEQGHIFDYNFVDETVVQTKTFIFVETDIDTVSRNIFTEFNLYIYIFSHKDLIRLSSTSTPTKNQVKKAGYYGNRIDTLCDAVDRMLNGNSNFGIGDVEPAPRYHMTIYAPSPNYYGKCLKYKVKNYNDGGDSCDFN